MNFHAVHALLSDTSGSILLVRRRGGLLLGLPGGDVRGDAAIEELLSTYCSRQVGVAPDFVGGMAEFTLAERHIAVGFAEIPHARAGARGRVEAAFWMRPDRLPAEIDPIARYAVAIQTQQAARAALGLSMAICNFEAISSGIRMQNVKSSPGNG